MFHTHEIGAYNAKIQRILALYIDTLESTPPQTEQNDNDQDFPIIGLFSYSGNILDRSGKGFSLSTVEYTGKRIQFDLTSTIISDDKNETDEYDVTLFILIDGYIQPYYFNGADTPVDYTLLRVKSSEQAEKYTLSFDPLYVPYRKNACVSVMMAIVSHQYFDNPHTDNFIMQTNLDFRITADSLEHQVLFEKKENDYDTRSNLDAKGENAWLVLTEKLTDPTKQFRIHTVFETNKPLYLYQFSPKSLQPPDDDSYSASDIRLFFIVDGKLVKPFRNRYYYDLNIKDEQLYEIPLDMNIFNKGERHLTYAFSIDKEAIQMINLKGFDTERSDISAGSSYCYNIMIK